MEEQQSEEGDAPVALESAANGEHTEMGKEPSQYEKIHRYIPFLLITRKWRNVKESVEESKEAAGESAKETKASGKTTRSAC